ncbi:MAG: glycosyltransferase family 9 protein [Gammaproteobacteria bacterium]|nr:glycosyltransferase family 9 protein [Gammaproteobacteria bacterium]
MDSLIKNKHQTHIINPETFCVLRLSAIGDVCHAVASVQALQKKYPNAKVTWIVGKTEYQLVSDLPDIEFIVVDKSDRLKAYLHLRRLFKDRVFDVLLHMQVSIRSSLIAALVKAKEKWGYHRNQAREFQWLFTTHKIGDQNGSHVVECFMDFARVMGVDKNSQVDWQVPISKPVLKWQQSLLKSHGKYVVIAPCASNFERNWSMERYVALANYLHQKGYSVVLCGSPKEREETFANILQSKVDFKLTNLVSRTSLKQLLAVLKHAEVLIAPDTGPVHMSVMMGTPVLGLYAHSNPLRTGPYKYLDYVVSCYEEVLQMKTGLPSNNHFWGKRLKGKHLMQLIGLQTVIETFERIEKDFKISAKIKKKVTS